VGSFRVTALRSSSAASASPVSALGATVQATFGESRAELVISAISRCSIWLALSLTSMA